MFTGYNQHLEKFLKIFKFIYLLEVEPERFLTTLTPLNTLTSLNLFYLERSVTSDGLVNQIGIVLQTVLVLFKNVEM